MDQSVGFWILDAFFIFVMAFLGSKLTNKFLNGKAAISFNQFLMSQALFFAGAFLGYVLFFGAHIVLRGGFTGLALAFFLLASFVLLVLYNFGISFCLYKRKNLDPKSFSEIFAMSTLVFIANIAVYFLMLHGH